jgi:hypothetical protein
MRHPADPSSADNAAHSPPSRNLRNEGISRAKPLASWHTVNLRSAHLAPIIRTSEHFHVFSPPPRGSVRMFGSGGKKRATPPSAPAIVLPRVPTCGISAERVSTGSGQGSTFHGWLTASPFSPDVIRPRRRLRCRRKRGPIQFLENNPVQSSLWVRFMCRKTRRNCSQQPR